MPTTTKRTTLPETTTKLPTTTTKVPTPENSFSKVFCRFYYDEDNLYTCELSNIQFRTDKDTFTISGTHNIGRKDKDVAKVVFINSELLKIPTILFDTFKNLSYLDINYVGLKAIDKNTFESCGKLKSLNARGNNIKLITEDSLQNCTKLTHIDLSDNRIQKLPSRVFSFNTKLTTIIINNNVITSIEPCNNVLQQLKNLKYLGLNSNMCVDKLFNDENLHLNFDRLVMKNLKNCFSLWFMN